MLTVINVGICLGLGAIALVLLYFAYNVIWNIPDAQLEETQKRKYLCWVVLGLVVIVLFLFPKNWGGNNNFSFLPSLLFSTRATVTPAAVIAPSMTPQISDITVYPGIWSEKINTLGYRIDFSPVIKNGERVHYQVRVNGGQIFEREFDPQNPSSVDYGNSTIFFEIKAEDAPIEFQVILTPLR